MAALHDLLSINDSAVLSKKDRTPCIPHRAVRNVRHGRSTACRHDRACGVRCCAVMRWVARGLIVREHDFSDWDEALRAIGIPTEAASPGTASQVASRR
jgi:hypothetical protein